MGCDARMSKSSPVYSENPAAESQVHTAYAWVKDAAGNVSAAKEASVAISLSDKAAPLITSFDMPGDSTSLTVPVSAFVANDNVAVTGYLITESSTIPSVDAAGWSATVPNSYTFENDGSRTAYAWVKDAAGNVSNYKAVNVTIR